MTVDKPFFEVDDTKLYVYRDPPHIIKNARNFLEKSPVHVPNCYGKASWSHLQQLYQLDLENSIRHAHKLTETHLSNLKFGNRMKVKLAVAKCFESYSVCCSQLHGCFKQTDK